MGLSRTKKFYFYEPEVGNLNCPLCKKIICVEGINCEMEECANHHEKEHLDLEGRNKLHNYLKSEYNENSKFSNNQNLLISYIVEDEQLHTLLNTHIHDYSKKIRRIVPSRYPKKQLEYVDTIILLAFELNFDVELEQLKKKHPKSKYWPQINQSKLEIKIDELIESQPNDFKQKVRKELLKIFNLTIKTPNCVKVQINKIIDNYGGNTTSILEFIIWLIKYEKKLKINNSYIWIAELWWIHVICKDKDAINNADDKLLDDMLERAMSAKNLNTNLCFTIAHHHFSRLDLKAGEWKNPSINQEMKKYVPKFERIFENYKEISSYITLFSHRVFVKYFEDNDNLIFPNWIDEKLVNAPEHIPRFEKMCKNYNKKYDFSTLSKNFDLSTFSKTLRHNHICNIIQKEPILYSDEGEDYSKLILFGGKGIIPSLKHIENKNTKEYLFDLPNIIRITKPKDVEWDDLPKEEKKSLINDSIELCIKFINDLEDDCYVHTTPSTCSHFQAAINKIQEKTNAKFLYYHFSEERDEDYFFLAFALRKNMNIITRDTFKNYKSILNSKIYKIIKSRTLKPQLNKSRDIELVNHKE